MVRFRKGAPQFRTIFRTCIALYSAHISGYLLHHGGQVDWRQPDLFAAKRRLWQASPPSGSPAG
jgi:hypothetical protein